MKFGKLFGWGVVIYAITRLTFDALVLYGLPAGYLARGINLTVLLFLCIIAGRSLRFGRWTDILPYSLVWAVIAATLDAVYVVPFVGWSLYTSPSLWVGYTFVVAFPLLAPLTRLHGSALYDSSQSSALS